MSAGVLVGDRIMKCIGLALSDGRAFVYVRVLLGDGVFLSDGAVLSDGVVLSDGAVLSDGMVLSDSVMQALSARVNGDETASANMEVDTGMDYLGF
jgi:acetyltransferase-like isoleucine patch superfamily enzyme